MPPLGAAETNIYRRREIGGHHIQIAANCNQSNNLLDAMLKNNKNTTVSVFGIFEFFIIFRERF